MFRINLLNGEVITFACSREYFDEIVEQIQTSNASNGLYIVSDMYIIPFTAIAFIQFVDMEGE